MEDLCLKILEQRGIKPTAIRMLVLKAMMETEQAVSLLDLIWKINWIQLISRPYFVRLLCLSLIIWHIV